MASVSMLKSRAGSGVEEESGGQESPGSWLQTPEAKACSGLIESRQWLFVPESLPGSMLCGVGATTHSIDQIACVFNNYWGS